MFIYITNLFFTFFMLLVSRKLITTYKRYSIYGYENQQYKSSITNAFIGVAFCSMFLIAGLRYFVGTDYPNYTEIFYSIINTDKFRFSFQFEPVFIIICKIIGVFSDNPMWSFIFTSFFITYFIFKAAITSTKYYELSIFLFIAFGFYTSSFNIIRQWMAVSVVLYAYRYLIKNDNKTFFKYALLAYGCHYSTIIIFPVYFFIRKPRKNSTRIIMMIIGIILYSSTKYVMKLGQIITLNIEALNKYYKYMMIDENIKGSVFVLPMFCIITYLMYMVFKEQIAIKTKGIEIYMNILSVGFVVSLIGQKLMIFNRLQFYFVSALIVILPQIVYSMKKEVKMIFYMLCVFLGTLFMIYSLLGNGGEPLPYQSVFSKL